MRVGQHVVIEMDGELIEAEVSKVNEDGSVEVRRYETAWLDTQIYRGP